MEHEADHGEGDHGLRHLGQVLIVFGQAPPATEPATVNGAVWHRAEGETKETFLARVKAEARPMGPGCGIVGFLE